MLIVGLLENLAFWLSLNEIGSLLLHPFFHERFPLRIDNRIFVLFGVKPSRVRLDIIEVLGLAIDIILWSVAVSLVVVVVSEIWACVHFLKIKNLNILG